MARNKNESTLDGSALAPVHPAITADIAAADQSALALRHLDQDTRALAARLGYQLPADSADPDLIQRDIAANMRRSVEACLEVGRGLCVLKAACGHGNFLARLEVLGIDRGVGARFIQAAVKFSNVPSTAHLTKAIGNQTKLFEMLVLDDEQLEELALTGQSGELTLDDVATMSVKELRAAVREAKGRLAAKEQVMADQDAENRRLREALAGKKPEAAPTPEFVAEAALREIDSVAGDIVVLIEAELRRTFVAALGHEASAGAGLIKQAMEGAIGKLLAATHHLVEDFDVHTAQPIPAATLEEAEDEAIWAAVNKDLAAMKQTLRPDGSQGDAEA
jgi:hypothetical protein